MTRSELIEKLAMQKNLTVSMAEKVIQEVFASMAETLIAGDRIEIRGFGSFEVREYGSYTARNPKTGAQIKVKPKRSTIFKVGKELKERILESGK